MKNLFLLLMLLFIGLGLAAQTLVSTEVQLKNAVLEEFTGIHCVYCPEGHVIAQSILDNNPGRAVAIAIHQGSFAVPSGSEPDYRTPWGNAIAGQAGVNSYPSATVNRHLFSGNVTMLGRGDWVSRCNEMMAQESPVNVGIESSYNASNRELTVHVELYYTSNAAQTTNFLNVALIQDHIFGPQTGGGAGNNYEHMHMLRDLITGQWGEQINTTTAGTFVDKTYIYTVPESFTSIPCVVENCQVAVFVTETHQEVLSGDVVDAIGGTNQFIGNVTTEPNMDIKPSIDSNPVTFVVNARSNLSGNQDFTFELTSENAPSDWSAMISINGTPYGTTATITLSYQVDTPILVSVLPSTNAALADFTLSMSAVSIPAAPTRYLHLYAVSGVENLVVNATGGPESVQHQDIYVNGLTNAGSTTVGVTDAEIMVKGINAQAFDNVKSIYFNVAWTFPALTLPQLAAMKSFMDNGGNLLIAGQDIGWDFMSGDAAGHGSPEATDFYNNYLYANYVADGNTANNLLIAEATDEVYGAIPQSAVTDAYGGNMYPEQISAREGGIQSFYYNAAKTKCAVVRAQTVTYKVVYFGVGFEMISNASVRDQILAATLDWFNSAVGINDSKPLTDLTIFPNPSATGEIHFMGNGNLKAVEIIDISGRTILKQNLTTSEALNINHLKQGIYFVKMFTSNEVITEKLQVK